MNTQIGWVYLMRNQSMPRMMKIGFTMDDPWERANQLSSSTSVPTPFTVVCALRTAHPKDLEDEMHRQLSERRVRSNREYFSTSIIIYYDAVNDAKFMADEEQENQWFILKLKHAAKLLAHWKRAWAIREKWEQLRLRLDAEEARLFKDAVRDYLEKKEVRERWMSIDGPNGPIMGGAR